MVRFAQMAAKRALFPVAAGVLLPGVRRRDGRNGPVLIGFVVCRRESMQCGRCRVRHLAVITKLEFIALPARWRVGSASYGSGGSTPAAIFRRTFAWQWNAFCHRAGEA